MEPLTSSGALGRDRSAVERVLAPGSLIETTARGHASIGRLRHDHVSSPSWWRIETSLEEGAAYRATPFGRHPPGKQNCAKLKTPESLRAAVIDQSRCCALWSPTERPAPSARREPHFHGYVKAGRYTIAYSKVPSVARARPAVSALGRCRNVGCPGPLIRKPRHGSIVSSTLKWNWKRRPASP